MRTRSLVRPNNRVQLRECALRTGISLTHLASRTDQDPGDFRVPTMRSALQDVAELTGGRKWVRMYDVLEKTMRDATGIEPNLDFPTGPTYYMMGFDIEVFTDGAVP